MCDLRIMGSQSLLNIVGLLGFTPDPKTVINEFAQRVTQLSVLE